MDVIEIPRKMQDLKFLIYTCVPETPTRLTYVVDTPYILVEGASIELLTAALPAHLILRKVAPYAALVAFSSSFS